MRVTVAVLDAAGTTYNGDIFHNHDEIQNTTLNSLAERFRDPPNTPWRNTGHFDGGYGPACIRIYNPS